MAAERAAGSGSDMLICPELFVSGHDSETGMAGTAKEKRGEYAERVGEISYLYGIAIVYGYPEKAAEHLYDSVACIGDNGHLLANHRKNHLTPDGEKEQFDAGSSLTIFEYCNWKIAISVGYDIEFPETARLAALAGAELLIVPAACQEARQFVTEKLIATRAFENGVYVGYANWAGSDGDSTFLGQSQIVAPDGSADAMAGRTETIIMATLEKLRVQETRAQSPYLHDCRTSRS